METFGPVEIPAGAWRRDDTREALRSRDVPALLRLAQQYSGVSQARLASAIGMGQGRVNEIMNRRRQVARLIVYERIADGLTMPDDARVLLGLAPADAASRGILTGHAEIARIFTNQAESNKELQDHAEAASEIDVLAARGLGLIALNDSLLRGPLVRRKSDVSLRLLLLDPEAPATAVRATEIGESEESFIAGIRLALVRLSEFSKHRHVRLQVAVYDSLPTWRMLAFDGTLYLSAFGVSSEGHRSGMYKLTAAAEGVLHAGFRRQFEEMWRQSRHLERESQTR